MMIQSLEQNKKYKAEKKDKKTQLSLSKQKLKKSQKPLKAIKVQKPKKKKKPTRGKLVKKLDSIFSQYIRLVSADKNGICTCITCGERMHRKHIQAGHFLTRGNYKYRRAEENVYSQCYVCNCIRNGNYKEYTLAMIRKHGQLKVEQMIGDKELVKIGTPRIEEQIENYTNIVKSLLTKIG